jgi:NADH:ubiquinone oxidoreductase subunit 5 (subunit L)/multisubunit Na+/H+ antiporter MnhA subunit
MKDISAYKIFRLLAISDVLISSGLLLLENQCLLKVNLNDIESLPFFLIISGIYIKTLSFSYFYFLSKKVYVPSAGLLYNTVVSVSCFVLLLQIVYSLRIPAFINIIFITIGAFIAIFSSIFSLSNNTIRKVVSLETTATIGLILVLIGFNFLNTAFYVLLTHIFLKIGFIILTNNIVEIMSGEQALDKMGGLQEKIRTTYILALILSFFMVSRWLILDFISPEVFYSQNVFFVIFYVLFPFLNALYILRFIFVIFKGVSRAGERVDAYIEEIHLKKQIPLIFCIFSTIFCIFFGFYKKEFFYTDYSKFTPTFCSFLYIALKIIFGLSIILFITFSRKKNRLLSKQISSNVQNTIFAFGNKLYVRSVIFEKNIINRLQELKIKIGIYFKIYANITVSYTEYFQIKKQDFVNYFLSSFYKIDKAFPDTVELNMFLFFATLSSVIVLLFFLY